MLAATLLATAAGFGYVYDARTGDNVGAHDFDGMFVNDVTVTRKAAYFTDSNKPFLYVYPAAGTPATRSRCRSPAISSTARGSMPTASPRRATAGG
jgi:hypothetical protein